MRSINQPFRLICQRFAAYATLGGLLLTASTAFAQAAFNAGPQPEATCPSTAADADPLSAEREIQWRGASGWARACWVDGNEQAKGQVVLALKFEGHPLVRHQPAEESHDTRGCDSQCELPSAKMIARTVATTRRPSMPEDVRALGLETKTRAKKRGNKKAPASVGNKGF